MWLGLSFLWFDGFTHRGLGASWKGKQEDIRGGLFQEIRHGEHKTLHRDGWRKPKIFFKRQEKSVKNPR